MRERVARLEEEVTRWRQRAEIVQAEAEARVADITRETDARIAAIRDEAQKRVGRAEAEAEERLGLARAEVEQHFARLEGDLARARELADRAKVEADGRIDRVVRGVDERVARAEADALARAQAEAERRHGQMRAEVEGHFTRLEEELARTHARAERAEQWLQLIQRQIEGHLLPTFAAAHDRMTPPEMQ